MPRGGKRDGAGRPDGAKDKRRRGELPQSKEITEYRKEAAEQMRSRSAHIDQAVDDFGPVKAIDVIREHMLWGRQVGDAMLEKCKEAAEAGETVAAVDWFNESMKLRAFSLKAAEAAVPYEEARLSAVVPGEPELKDVTPDGQRMMNEGGRLNHIKARFAKGLTIVDGGKG